MSVVEEDFDYEAQLLACARGDAAALQRLYRREAARLLGVAMRIVRRRDLAEDVLHDAFVKVWERAGTFDPSRGSGRGWLYSVVRHGALNRIRDGAREVLDDDLVSCTAEQQGADEVPDPYAQISFASETDRLDHCLQRLEAAKRSCIVLAYVEGCSHSEIAARLKSPLGSVKAWIRRGLQSLRECMA